MSLEDQYDAWVRGLMGGKKYAATSKQAEEANDAVQQMQASLDALTAAQKRQSAAGSGAGCCAKSGRATAESVRKMSSELTRSLHQDGLLGGTTAAPAAEPKNADKPVSTDFSGAADKIKAQVLGQDAFVSALVKAFRRPLCDGHGGGHRPRPQPDAAVRPQRHRPPTTRDLRGGWSWPAGGFCAARPLSGWTYRSIPAPAQEKLFLQDLYAAAPVPMPRFWPLTTTRAARPII